MNRLALHKTITIFLFSLILGGIAQANSCDELTVNGGQNWYPFFDRSQPNRYGIIGDVVYQAAERQGIRLKMAPAVSWKRLLFNLKNGKLDLVAGALKTADREKIFNYSSPIYYSQLNIYVAKDKVFTYTTAADLLNKRGLKVRGMSLGQDLDKYAFENLVIEETTDTSSLFKMIAAGRVDYGVFYLHSGIRELKRIKLAHKVVPLPTPIAKEPIFVAFSKSTRCSSDIERLSIEIEKMKADGSIRNIVSSYINHENNNGVIKDHG